MDRWKEKLAFAALILALLIPICVTQAGIDTDEAKVAFLRWIDNQEAYQGQVLQRIVSEDEERSTEEAELFKQVEELGYSLNPDFNNLAVKEKWQVINDPRFREPYETFQNLARQRKLSLLEGEIEWANPDVSANVGALVLGFRKLVADMLWLKVDEYWHLGLVERMLPMMQTVVALDPHFIEAYALGGWHLAYNVAIMFGSKEEQQKYIDQGIKFLEQGIKNNPRSSKLYAELGFTMYFRKLSDWEKAAYYLGEAVRFDHEPWVERAYGLSLERLGKEEKALAVFEDYDRRHPEFVAQRSSIARLRKKLEARKLEEAGHLEQAFEIWKFLKEDDPGDVIAPREVLRLRAIVQGRQDVSS
jgi:tetratricopeptide (TPR) repeat protein